MRALPLLPLLLLVLASALSGCSSGPDRPTLQARAETREVPDSEIYPGLSVKGTLSAPSGGGLLVAALAKNVGPRTYDVETGCSSPWTQHLYRGNESIPLRRPVASCGAGQVQFTGFAPGDTRPFEARWDGSMWSEEAKAQVSAPPGEYTWSVRFVAYPQDNVAAKRFDLDFEVTVLAD